MAKARGLEAQGIKKAAILLVSLEQEEESRIMGALDEATLEKVTQAVASLGVVQQEERDRVIEEFYQMNVARQYVQQGGIEYAKALLKKSVPADEAERIVSNVEETLTSRPFSFLQKADARNLLGFIQDEHPQTIALVLAHVEASQAAEVIKGLGAKKQVEVIKRLASMESTSPEVIQEVEEGLEKRMGSATGQELRKTAGLEAAAQILNLSDRATEKSIMETLGEESPELTEEIRKLMFVFEDILLVDDRGVRQLLKEVETEDLALAMKTASEELKEKIYRNMSERAAQLLREDIEYLGPVRLVEVEAAQQRIADAVRRLEDAGAVIVQGRGGEETLVV